MTVPEVRVPTPPFVHAAVIGGGGVGGSVGLALQERGAAQRVTLLDPEASVRTAWAERAVAAVSRLPFPDPPPDFVVLAAPPRANLEWLPEILRTLPDALLTDVTSIKRPIVDAAAARRQGVEALRFVGSHPMAGSERAGPVAARSDLFVGCVVVLCAVPGAPTAALQAVARTWRLLGALPVEMSAADHDAAVAVTSHLPQLTASLLAAYLGESAPPDSATELLIGPGARDTTRLAAGLPELWREILEANADSLRPHLRAMARRWLELAEGGPAEWQHHLERGRAARRRWEGE